MDTLFNTNFENFESSHFEPQVKLRAQTYDLQESNVRLRLTVVNTVGFGDQMNKEDRWEGACENVIMTAFLWSGCFKHFSTYSAKNLPGKVFHLLT